MKIATSYKRLPQTSNIGNNCAKFSQNFGVRGTSLTRFSLEQTRTPLFSVLCNKKFSTNNRILKNREKSQQIFTLNFFSKKFKSFYCTTSDSLEKVDNLTILWGSQTGTAKSFAEDLHHQILDKNILEKSNVKIFDLRDFQNVSLFNTSIYFHFKLTSTKYFISHFLIIIL